MPFFIFKDFSLIVSDKLIINKKRTVKVHIDCNYCKKNLPWVNCNKNNIFDKEYFFTKQYCLAKIKIFFEVNELIYIKYKDNNNTKIFSIPKKDILSNNLPIIIYNKTEERNGGYSRRFPSFYRVKLDTLKTKYFLHNIACPSLQALVYGKINYHCNLNN
jgi:hypothetical protein